MIPLSFRLFEKERHFSCYYNRRYVFLSCRSLVAIVVSISGPFWDLANCIAAYSFLVGRYEIKNATVDK